MPAIGQDFVGEYIGDHRESGRRESSAESRTWKINLLAGRGKTAIAPWGKNWAVLEPTDGWPVLVRLMNAVHDGKYLDIHEQHKTASGDSRRQDGGA